MDEERVELARLYEAAWEDGVWFREWEGSDGRYLAAAGLVSELEQAEAGLRAAGRLRPGEELTQLDLSDGEVVLEFTTFVRAGDSRVEACSRAWRKLRRHRPRQG